MKNSMKTIFDKNFQPAWWLANAHAQTVWPTLLRRKINIAVRPERLELPDGDFLDLVWIGKGDGPIVIVLHGLGGSIHSPYAMGMLQTIAEQGWRGVFIHFRGCSGEPNRLPRSYHSGETGDLQYVITELQTREPHTPLAAIGFSLGGNVLLKWLGETAAQNPLSAAVAVSVPFELHQTSNYLNQGTSRFYQWWLLRQLRIAAQTKFARRDAPFDMRVIAKLNNFWQFDDTVTAPLHGFKNAADYYQQSSSRQFLAAIQVPTLIVHAKDDPFVPSTAIPTQQEISTQVQLQITEKGGHVGFIAGDTPWQPIYWIEQRVAHFLQQFF